MSARLPLQSMDGACGERFSHAAKCTLADYTAAGTTAPAVGDIVTPSSAGNWYVKRAADNATKRLGEVTKIELAPSGTDEGLLSIEWFDAERVVEVDTDDLTSVTLGNSLIKDGDTSVADNFDAGATTGPIVAVSKSGTAGAGKVYGLVFGA